MFNIIQMYKNYKQDVKTFTKLVEENKEHITFKEKIFKNPTGESITLCKSYQIRKPNFYLSSYKNEASCYDNGGAYTLFCSVPVGKNRANHLINNLLAEKVFNLCDNIYKSKQR